ncbi:MAG: MotA/TolQ/ExbB proton channel family protein [Planctomycetes bacterium]|nr:MotA/TolQ/ExbB proton channel family protein [Planctomycetota bacterium]
MIKNLTLGGLLLLLLLPALRAQESPVPESPAAGSAAQEGPAPTRAQEPAKLEDAARSAEQRLEASLRELAELRAQMAAEKLPLSKRLSELEAELTAARQEFQKTSRDLDDRALKLNSLRDSIKSYQNQASHLSTLVTDYLRNFESRLHVVEIQRYKDALAKARLARENTALTPEEVFEAQAELVELSLTRLHEALGGTTFPGHVVATSGLVIAGRFTLVGPAAVFRSEDGQHVGTAEQKLGSLEPALIPFARAEDADAARALVASGEGTFPLDPTLGNAHKIEETQETLLEHIQAGGPVMYPIFAMAGTALLVVILKWVSFLFMRRPSRSRVAAMLAAIRQRDHATAVEQAQRVGGPTGRMLAVGAQHLGEPRELIEEVMYETVLETKLRLNRWLPFVAICASSAPLLGLLGTVTGIMNTFKLITVFGSGDVKMLSGGISEALITTEYGLIVAIPSLLLHALLSRKAKGMLDQMEKSAVEFLNQVAKTQPAGVGSPEDFRDDELSADVGYEFIPAMPRARELEHARAGQTDRTSRR